jgi:DNA-binding transcriptional LysR family regulator
MDMQDLRIFARVAQIQNLSAVGSEMGLTPGTVSKRLQALEQELGVRLFDRTTRSMRITEEGATFVTHANRILAEFDQARATVADRVAQPKGRLKVAVPAAVGRLVMAQAICGFVRAYPEIEVHVSVSDNMVNLQDEGFDLVIRCGALSDSALIAKRLAADRHVIVAAPNYLDLHGVPGRPSDLAGHSCLLHGETQSWSFERDSVPEVVRVSGRVRSDNSEFLQQAAIAGEGVARLSEMAVRDSLATGALRNVLTPYDSTGQSAVWAVYSSSRHMLPKLRVLLDYLGDWFRDIEARGRLTPTLVPSASPLPYAAE